jgi:hypothetical protein
MKVSDFLPGRTYTFSEVATAFGMKAAVLTWQGGIISRPAQNALLLTTKATGGADLDYHDYWDGEDLIYGARGQKGDQKMTGANRILAYNERTNYVFEALGGAQMRYRGTARALRHWWDLAPDADGVDRQVLRYLLHFGSNTTEDVPDLLGYHRAAPEGQRGLTQHISIERNRAVVADAKRYWRLRDPLLRCEVCTMSFVEHYGTLGVNFIEAHHRIPLGSLDGTTETRIADLAPVCANCHRMLHAGQGCSVSELRSVLASVRETASSDCLTSSRPHRQIATASSESPSSQPLRLIKPDT